MLEFPFDNNLSKSVYNKSLERPLDCVSQESKDYIALVETHIHEVLTRRHLLDEEVNKYKVLLNLLSQRQKLIEQERLNSERKLKQELTLRKSQAFTPDDVNEFIARVLTVVIKYIPSDKQLSVISELKELTKS